MKQNFLLLFLLFTVCNVFSQTVYITKTGEKYHIEACAYLKNSSIEIQLADAIDRGYQACKVCKPNSGAKLKPEAKNSTVKQEISSKQGSASVQCSGTTKKGPRCKRMTTSSNGRCYQH